MTAKQTLKISDDAEIRIVPVENLEPSDDNPNEMSDEDFELLGDSMEDDGLVDVLQVVPLDDREGCYRIVGGEHRWRQARRKGWQEVPVMVLSGEKWKDEDRRRAMMVKLNVLKGKLSPRKFYDLWTEMSGRYREEVLAPMMGFAKSDALQKIIAEYRKKLKAAGVSGEQVAEFDKKAKKAKTVDDLKKIIGTVMKVNEEHGRKQWMVLSIEGQDHLYVECDDRLWKLMGEVTKEVEKRGIELPEVFSQAFIDWKKLPCFK